MGDAKNDECDEVLKINEMKARIVELEVALKKQIEDSKDLEGNLESVENKLVEAGRALKRHHSFISLPDDARCGICGLPMKKGT